MKIIKLLMLFCLGAFLLASTASAQVNPSAAILPVNAGGVVAQGAIMDVKVTISNTGTGSIVAFKLRPNITMPPIVTILPTAQQTGLPANWSVVTNTGNGQIRICNGTDVIAGGESRDIFIKVQGATIGGPASCEVQINYGGASCAAPGPQPTGNNGIDDFAASSVTVSAAAACALTLSASAGTIACNGGTTTLTATPAGANGAVEYSITGAAPFQSSNVFTVPAGTYTVTAREVAATTCTATSTSVVVAEPAAVVANATVTTPIATVGGTGTVTVTATGGTGTKTYTVTGGNTSGATSGVFTGLVAGSYTFTATDANGCTGTSVAVLNNPAACIITGVTATAGTILCNGGTTTITAVAAPAGPVYEYSLNGGAFQASGSFLNVAAGTYTVVAREAGNTVCTATSSSVAVTAPAAVAATAAVTTAIAVPGGTGTITVSATGGTGTKTYVITSGTTTNTTGAASGVFTGLLAGSYTFTATDANGCTGVSAPLTLANPGIATADPAVGQMFFTTTTGVEVSANTLLLSPAADLYDIKVPFYNLNQLNVVPNGTISFSVNLGRKLVLAPGFNLAAAPLSTYFSWAQSSVNGDIIVTGTQIATIPADFESIAVFRVKGDSACRSNVVSNITITNILQTLADDDLQNNTATLQYNLPITLAKSQVNVTCSGAGNGIINIVASSGTSVVTTGPGGYTNTTGLPSGVNTFALAGLAPGVYTITATAPSVAPLVSCSATTTVTILQPTVLTLPVANITNTNINCFGATDGTITVVASGGTAPYNYTIAGPTVNTTGALSGVFTGLAAGSYTVTVTDNNGCTATTAAIIITQPIGGIPDISLGSDVTGSLFTTPGVTQTIVYNIAEIAGNSAVGDTLRITKVNGFTINFNPTIFSTTVGATTYALDNPRWKIDNSNPAFVSIILTDPGNSSNPGTLFCNQLVRVAVSITRNTSNISTFTLSARLRQANGEVNLNNNLNSIIFAAE
ncbi:MAG: SprB repeat-containing protein [Rhizobacter sp.]|nr:SprB repeat-containing protein [Ferruginibacter sp.]